MPRYNVKLKENALKTLRAREGLIQEAAAAKAGIGHTTWARAEETGEASAYTVEKIAKGFGVNPWDIAPSLKPENDDPPDNPSVREHPETYDTMHGLKERIRELERLVTDQALEIARLRSKPSRHVHEPTP